MNNGPIEIIHTREDKTAQIRLYVDRNDLIRFPNIHVRILTNGTKVQRFHDVRLHRIYQRRSLN